MRKGKFWILFMVLILTEGASVFAQSQAQLMFYSTPQRNHPLHSLKRIDELGHSVFFESGADSMAAFVLRILPDLLQSSERYLNTKLEGGIQIMLFRNAFEMTESNVASEDIGQKTGWSFPFVGNKLAVCYGSGKEDLVIQLNYGINRLLISEILYGGNSWEKIQNKALLVLPRWFTDGLALFLSAGFSTEMNITLSLWLRVHPKAKYSNLVQEEPYLAGVLFWQRFVQEKGWNNIPRLLRFVKAQREVKSGYYLLFRESYPLFLSKILADFRNSVVEFDVFQRSNLGEPLSIGDFNLKQIRPLRVDTKARQLAFAAFRRNRLGVYVSDRSSKQITPIWSGKAIHSTTRNLRFHLPEFSPILCWHPNSQRLILIHTYDRLTNLMIFQRGPQNEWVLQATTELKLDKVHSVDWSPNGKKIALIGSRSGVSGIYGLDPVTWSLKMIWADSHDKRDIRFGINNEDLFFVSTLIDDPFPYKIQNNIQLDKRESIFRLSLSSDPPPMELYASTEESLGQPIPLDSTTILFLSNRNGVNNQFRLNFSNSGGEALNRGASQVSDSKYSIVWHDAPRQGLMLWSMQDSIGNSMGGIFRRKITQGMLDNVQSGMGIRNFFWKSPETNHKSQDSSRIIRKNNFALINLGLIDPIPSPVSEDSRFIFVNKYAPIFSESENLDFKVLFADLQRKKVQNHNLHPRLPTPYVKASSIHHYALTVGSSLMQLDIPSLGMTALNYLHPIPGAVFNLSIRDVTEDYRLSLGAIVLNSTSRFQSFLYYENLSNLLDWRILGLISSTPSGLTAYSRDQTSNSLNTTSLEGHFSMTYPIGNYQSLQAVVATINRRILTPATSDNSKLNTPVWDRTVGLRTEWILDQTKSFHGAIFKGVRAKFFMENYLNTGTRFGHTGLLGLDFRMYQGLRPGLVYAFRLGSQVSSGRLRVNYMLGGTEQWLYPSFNKDMPLPGESVYLFNALAMGVRGLPLNTRNGDAFMALNQEVRLSPSGWRSSVPSGSEFYRSLNLIGFMDFGSSWRNGNFWSIDSLLFPNYVHSGNVHVQIDRRLSPLLWSMGFGIKARVWGYSIRVDRAWSWENYTKLPPQWVFSMGMDF